MSLNTSESVQNFDHISLIRKKYNDGQITYDEASEQLKEYIKKIRADLEIQRKKIDRRRR